VGQPLPTVGAALATHRIQLQIGAKSVAQRERRTNHDKANYHHTSSSRSQVASNSVSGRRSIPTASPDSLISELVSRQTTVETPGSPQPQPARRGRIREDATVPQPSVIPTRTSPGRLSPRAPTASPDSTSARRSQRLEPERPRTSTSTWQRQVGAQLVRESRFVSVFTRRPGTEAAFSTKAPRRRSGGPITRNPVAALPVSSPNAIEEVVHQASSGSRDLERPVAMSDNLQPVTGPTRSRTTRRDARRTPGAPTGRTRNIASVLCVRECCSVVVLVVS
jgi:hypothetical protein